MSVSAHAVGAHLDYSAWASSRILEAAARLSPDELTRDFKTADRTVLDTLVHTFAADRLWFSRIEGKPRVVFIEERDRDLGVLQEEWPAVHERWRTWAAALSDEAARAQLAYADLKGRQWQQPVWQIVLHVVNHATHHRGAVSGFVRAMGHTPPVLDLIAFYRQTGAQASAG